MATIALDRHECQSEFLPSLCMRCGIQTDEFHEIAFSKSDTNPAFFLLILLGPIGHIAMALIPKTTKTRRVETPLCHSHRNHWGWNKFYIVSLLSILAVICIAYGMFYDDVDKAIPNSIVYLVFIVLAVFSVTYLISTQEIHCKSISPHAITLTGINRAFVDELASKRSQFEEAFRNWQASENSEID